jgi:prepilin-type N-terminal cleavage/methylation domain-containing protein
MNRRHLISKKLQAGFTLMEFLLVVAILSIISVICVPIYASLQNTNGLDVAMNTLVQDLYQAQLLSRSETHNSPWGVAISGTNQTITLYAGTSYASRNSAYDTVFTFPTTSTTSGLSEIDFSMFYGLPQSTGSITLKSGNTTNTATINSQGMVDY